MGVGHRRQTEQRSEIGLPWCGGQQVVAADDLVDALRGVVHDDREVVGRHPVVTTEHHVVHHPGERAAQDIVDRPAVGIGPQPQRARAPARRRSSISAALRSRQVPG